MSALLDLAAADAGAESDVSSAHEAGVKRQRTNDPSFGGSSSVLPEEPEPEDAMHNGAHPQFYASVRVRQPKKGYEDEVYFDWNSSRRTGTYAVGGSAGSSSPRAQREEEARRKAEEARLAKEQARLAAEVEEREWDLPEGLEITADLEAMLRILRELFAPKYLSFARPFTDPTEAKENGLDWFVARPNARRARLPLTRPSLALCPPFIQIVLQPMSSRSTVLLARTIWMKVPRFQLISRGLLSTPCTAARCYMGSHISPWMRFLQRCWRASCRRVGLTVTRMLSTFIQRTLGLYAYCPG